MYVYTPVHLKKNKKFPSENFSVLMLCLVNVSDEHCAAISRLAGPLNNLASDDD